MKKIIAVVLACAFALCLAGCSSGSSSSGGASASSSSAPAEPLSLDGTWKQTNSNSESSWQEAVIEGNTITVNWVSTDSKSLYWAGSYDAPTTTDDKYSWTSVNDKEQTSRAMLASGADTKEFSYENGVLSYEASAMGSTVTVKLERVS